MEPSDAELGAWCDAVVRRRDALLAAVAAEAEQAFAARRFDRQRTLAAERLDRQDALGRAAAAELRQLLGADDDRRGWCRAWERVAADPARRPHAAAVLADAAGPLDRAPPPVATPELPEPAPNLVCSRRDAGHLADAILAGARLPAPLAEPAIDRRTLATAIGRAIGAETPATFRGHDRVFLRNTNAYLVGELRSPTARIPLGIALENPPAGVRIDAVLTDEAELIRVFAFSRSYFAVAADDLPALVALLHEILPSKPVEQLCIHVGLGDLGRLAIRADLDRRAASGCRFVPPPGTPGLVLAVFTADGLDRVVKVPRDVARPPKSIAPQQVFARYRFVARRDRVGRLADCQEIGGLRFPRAAFATDVLSELEGECAGSVDRDGDDLVIHRALVERRLVPLDVFLATAPPDAAHAAVLDYGRAIEELVWSNVFPGDLLPKNFGRTRNGRVVFFDFDEVTALVDQCFRDLPQSRDDDDEWAAEPWFPVRDNDVFPAELRTFLPPPDPWRKVFVDAFPHLFDPAWWNSWKAFHEMGGMHDLRPYRRT